MLFISNEDVQKVLTIEDTLRVLERGHKELARGELASRPRVDTYTETSDPGRFHRWGTMEGASKGLGRFAIRMKSDVVSWPAVEGRSVEEKYCVRPGLFCGLIFLFDTESGEPLALINDGYLQHLRVGASAGLAVKYLARKDAAVVGMLGSGRMLEPGMHLTSVAGEYAGDVYPKIDVCGGGGPRSQMAQGIPIDSSRGFTTYLAGSKEALESARGRNRLRQRSQDFRARVVALVDLFEGAEGRRNEKEISASGSLNIGKVERHQGLQFVTVGSLVYEKVKEAGLGREVPVEWFLQDIRD